MSDLINLQPYSEQYQINWIEKYNDISSYDLNSKCNFYIPYKDIFNSIIFKNNNQIIICYSKIKSKTLRYISSSTYRWLRNCHTKYSGAIHHIFYDHNPKVFYIKSFVNNYFIIDNGFISVAKYDVNRFSTDFINIQPLMCLCLKTNNILDFAKNKEQKVIDKKHFSLLIDHKFMTEYLTVYKKIDKEYIQKFRNEGYDILYCNIEEKIYNTDTLISSNKFKSITELFSYLDSLNDELKQM
jgi:hypothetical protein